MTGMLIQGPIILSTQQVVEMHRMRNVTGKQVIYDAHPSKCMEGFHDILIGNDETQADGGDGVWLEACGEYNYG